MGRPVADVGPAAGAPSRWPPWAVDLRAALPGWLAARAVVGAALLIAWFVRHHTGLRLPYTERFARPGLLGWDADWYASIARHGYAGAMARRPGTGLEALRFFPALPLLARGLGLVVGVSAALLILSSLPALALGATTHRLTLEVSGDPAAARRAAWLVALAPPAFVLVMGYTEAIALTLLVATLIAARRRAWVWAAVFGFGCGICRPTGLLVCLPLLVEAARGVRASPWPERAVRAAAVAAPAAGALVYLGWAQAVYGDWYLPFRVQQVAGLRGKNAFPLVTVVKAAGGLVTGHVGTDAHFVWVLILVALLVPTVRALPPSLAALGVATVVVALSADRLGSLERYAWGCVVIVIAVAIVARGPRLSRLLLPLSGLAMAAYATLAFLGYYVP